ncbi:hypothetical protein P9273_24630 [Mesorhizobium sp. WSM4935]|uniref:hypothetical protein n=1 Tax=Mesorhizobium sp. WSM4935 TaxID=3038547 RepID=UPI00241591E8|nr:hypothetical protein [Mesorhizobium sp. WSM4935]MDG4878265.1 hypothetical protein [Mesorhizobium sp. WSM4935]
MDEQDKFAIWIAASTLRSGNREIDALALDDIAQQVRGSGDLERELAAMRQFDRRGGDFGAEIVGAVVIPILIEAGKQLWAAYLKKLTDKAAGQLADVTADEVKALVRGRWSRVDESARADFETFLRAEAVRQGLSEAQTEGLLAALHQPGMPSEIAKA